MRHLFWILALTLAGCSSSSDGPTAPVVTPEPGPPPLIAGTFEGSTYDAGTGTTTNWRLIIEADTTGAFGTFDATDFYRTWTVLKAEGTHWVIVDTQDRGWPFAQPDSTRTIMDGGSTREITLHRVTGG